MKQYLPLLQKNPLFSTLSQSVLETHILPHAYPAEYPKGAHLIRTQETCSVWGFSCRGK